jgi:hypothetical protein
MEFVVKINRNTVVLVFVGLLVLTGCASEPERSVALEKARAAVDRVTAHPDAAQVAGIDLEAARSALARAETVWQRDGDNPLVEHHAYLASRYADIVDERVAEQAARTAIGHADAQRNELLLEAKAAAERLRGAM